jgi:hypothetical protein
MMSKKHLKPIRKILDLIEQKDEDYESLKTLCKTAIEERDAAFLERDAAFLERDNAVRDHYKALEKAIEERDAALAIKGEDTLRKHDQILRKHEQIIREQGKMIEYLQGYNPTDSEDLQEGNLNFQSSIGYLSPPPSKREGSFISPPSLPRKRVREVREFDLN